MKNGKLIALSALTATFGTIFLVFGAYFSTFDLSCLFMASVAIMFPLSKDSVKGAFLAYLAIVLLSFIMVGGKFYISILYTVFFGVYPIVNYFQLKKNKIFSFLTIIKMVWFILTLLLMVYLFKLFTVTNPIIDKYLPFIVVIGGGIFFIFFDYVMLRFQKTTKILINRLKL
ncbi:MAG: hypothetical protein J6Q58_05110 [Clostridia bacterium]|nr:hypothetical protein [Clostridia bacterium]